MLIFYRPEHAVIRLSTKLKGSLQTPTTTLITVKDPNGNIVAGPTAMTTDSAGRHHYNYDTNLDADDGDYTVIFKTTYATLISISKDTFKVDTP